MSLTEVLVALVIAVGLVGVLVPVLPGSILILVAILVWAVQVGSTSAWAVFAIAAVVLAGGGIVKYLVPNRRLRAAGIPASTQCAGAALGVVGFFVVPVVGVVLGFMLGIYLAECRRLGAGPARSSTGQALRAVGLSIVIELAAGLAAALLWLVGVVAT